MLVLVVLMSSGHTTFSYYFFSYQIFVFLPFALFWNTFTIWYIFWKLFRHFFCLCCSIFHFFVLFYFLHIRWELHHLRSRIFTNIGFPFCSQCGFHLSFFLSQQWSYFHFFFQYHTFSLLFLLFWDCLTEGLLFLWYAHSVNHLLR